ncbi:MAG: hypothetical protein JWO81_872 [Alphaproteobacteria bacterium]|nr:hypothetical protein [Alphaproteobacteria bacterium]
MRRARTAAFAVFGAMALSACGGPAPVVPGSPVSLELQRRLQISDNAARQLAFSPDGSLLAASAANGTILLWPTHERAKPRRLVQEGGVTSLAFSGDGRLLASGGYDGTVRLWRVADGAMLRRLGKEGGGTVWTVDVSRDGTRIASSGEDKLVHLWRTADGAQLAALKGHRLNVWEVRFTPDGTRLVSSSFDHDIRIWDGATGKPLRTLSGHEEAAVGLAISPDGTTIGSGSDDSTVRLWRLADGRPLRRMAAGNHAYSVAFSPDGRMLASGGRARGDVGTFWHQLTGGGAAGQSVRLWRVADGALLAAASQPEDVMAVAFSPDGGWLATASEDGTATLWRVRRR